MEADCDVLQSIAWVAVLQPGGVERRIPGPVDAQLDVAAGHPVGAVRVAGGRVGDAIHRVGVLLAPEPDQPGGDEPDARIAVILLAKRSDEILHQGLHPLVVVIGGETNAFIIEKIITTGLVDTAGTEEIVRHPGLLAGIVQVEAERGLVPARRDGLQLGLELGPVIVLLTFDHRIQRQVEPLHRVGKIGGIVVELLAEGHEPLEGIVRPGSRRLKRLPGRLLLGVRGGQRGCEGKSRDRSHGDGAKSHHWLSYPWVFNVVLGVGFLRAYLASGSHSAVLRNALI